MMKRKEVYAAIHTACKPYRYSISRSKKTRSIYVLVRFGVEEISIRISDHPGKNEDGQWFDYTAPEAKFYRLVNFIESRIHVLKSMNLEHMLKQLRDESPLRRKPNSARNKFLYDDRHRAANED